MSYFCVTVSRNCANLVEKGADVNAKDKDGWLGIFTAFALNKSLGNKWTILNKSCIAALFVALCSLLSLKLAIAFIAFYLFYLIFGLRIGVVSTSQEGCPDKRISQKRDNTKLFSKCSR